MAFEAEAFGREHALLRSVLDTHICAADLRVSGPRIFDLHIGLIALENGARELWTHDRAFIAPPGLRVVRPLV